MAHHQHNIPRSNNNINQHHQNNQMIQQSHQQQQYQSPFDDGSMVMQMGMQFGTRIIDEGKGRLSSIQTSELKKRFAVSHEFVLGKLKLLAFPFRTSFARDKNYNLSTAGGGDDSLDLMGTQGSASSDNSNNDVHDEGPASGDILAPDLYLPLMSLITYVVLCAFGTGLTSSQFSPSALATTVTASTTLVVFEALAIKLWRMMTSLPPPVFFDTIALFGYFYVNVCYALVARALFEAWLFPLSWLLTFYFLGSFGFFLYKCLGETFDKDGTIPKRAIPILYGAVLVQAPLFLWFVRRAY